MKPAYKKYQTLINRLALRPIANDDELDLASEVADELCMRDLGKDEEDYLHVLTMLIEEYEIKAGHVPDDVVTPLEMLKFLMDENKLKQGDLIKILGISSGNASEIMSGKRELSKAQIPVMAARFGVNPSVFLPAVEKPTPSTIFDPQKLHGSFGTTEKAAGNKAVAKVMENSADDQLYLQREGKPEASSKEDERGMPAKPKKKLKTKRT